MKNLIQLIAVAVVLILTSCSVEDTYVASNTQEISVLEPVLKTVSIQFSDNATSKDVYSITQDFSVVEKVQFNVTTQVWLLSTAETTEFLKDYLLFNDFIEDVMIFDDAAVFNTYKANTENNIDANLNDGSTDTVGKEDNSSGEKNNVEDDVETDSEEEKTSNVEDDVETDSEEEKTSNVEDDVETCLLYTSPSPRD